MSLVDIRNLRLSFPGRMGLAEVLRGVDLSIESGQVLGLVGESGSGKSLTGLVMMGLQDDRARVTADRLDVLGCDMLQAPAEEKRRLRGEGVAMVFQNPTTCLDPHYRIGSQVEEVLRLRGGESRQSAPKKALSLLREVGLDDAERVASRFPHELSGGMNQRVMIALAIALRPQLLIADEPTTALDVTTQSRIIALFRELAQRRKMAILFISHDLGVIKNLCDSVVVLYAGRVVETGDCAGVIKSPAHPYTAALLQSRPTLAGPTTVPAGIPGLPPRPGEAVSGCAFAPRCSHALADCCSSIPPLLARGAQSLACFLNDGDGLR